MSFESDLRQYMSVLPFGTSVRNIRTEKVSTIMGVEWNGPKDGWSYFLSDDGTWANVYLQPWWEIQEAVIGTRKPTKAEMEYGMSLENLAKESLQRKA